MIWTIRVREADGSIGERKMNTETVEEARGYLEEAGLEILDDEAPDGDQAGTDAGSGADLDAGGGSTGADADATGTDAGDAAGADGGSGGDGAADGASPDAAGADPDVAADATAAAGADEPPAEVTPKRSRAKKK